jgi:hypothetical protein
MRHCDGGLRFAQYQLTGNPSYTGWIINPACHPAAPNLFDMATNQITRLHYLFPIFGLVLFGLFGAQLMRTEYRSKTSTTWPTTDGVVIKSAWMSHNGKGCHYSLQFQYTYKVGDRSYSGNNYRFGGECNEEDVMRITTMYPVGAHVLVHYHPDNPNQSVISPDDISRNTKLGMIIFPIMMSLCAYLFFKLYRERRRQLSGEFPQ